MRRAITCLLILPLATADCAPREDTQQELFVSAPLDFDPTEEYDLSNWWSNDRQLLFLGDGGFYALFDTTNRYRGPAERGRWWQQTFAALWLEPYAELQRQSRRVSIGKIGGRLALNVGRLESMFAIDRPPEVIEDRLIGVWQGAAGHLRLDANGRYMLRPRREWEGRRARPAAVAGHQGTWRVVGDQLRLEPDSPKTQTVTLALQYDEETLELAGGELIPVSTQEE